MQRRPPLDRPGWGTPRNELRRLVVGGGRAPGFPRLRPNDISLNIDPDAQPDVLADIAATGLPDASFDTVYGEALPYPVLTEGGVPVAREIARLLRDGGHLTLVTGVAAPVGRIIVDLEDGGFGGIRVSRRASLRISAQVVREGGRRLPPRGRIPAEVKLFEPQRIDPPEDLREALEAITPATAHSPQSLALLRSFISAAFASRNIRRDPNEVLHAVLHEADRLAAGPRAHGTREVAWMTYTGTFWAMEDEIALDPLRQARAPIAHRLQLEGVRDYGIDLRPVPVRVAELRALDRIAAQSGMTPGQVLASGIEVLARIERERHRGASLEPGRWDPRTEQWTSNGHAVRIAPRPAHEIESIEVPVRVDRYVLRDVARMARRQGCEPVAVTAAAVAAVEAVLSLSRSGRGLVANRDGTVIPLFQRVERHATGPLVG